MAEPRRITDAGDLSAGQDTAPTQSLSLGSGGERCINCGAPLASDQRYCVNCGERRGKPRFEVADGAAPPAEYATVTTTTAGPPPPRRTRTSTGLNLIAGVATLLLAMGVGVLIGHNSAGNAKSASTPATQVITVGGGSGAGTSTAANSGSAASSGSGTQSHHGSKSTGSSSHTAAKAPTKVVIQKAAAAASKVTGGSAPVASPTVTQGGSCSSGQAGCQNGKFTGNNFFGQ